MSNRSLGTVIMDLEIDEDVDVLGRPDHDYYLSKPDQNAITNFGYIDVGDGCWRRNVGDVANITMSPTSLLPPTSATVIDIFRLQHRCSHVL